MSETYAPRTVAIVALSSLVLGFLLVFGGGMALLRAPSRDGAGGAAADDPARGNDAGAGVSPGSAPSAPGASPSVPTTAGATTGAAMATAATDAGADPGGDPGAGGGAAGVSAGGITLGPAAPSRCYNPGPLVPIPGAQCDRLTALDQYFTSKASEIAACARPGAHGRLSLYLDFRFSTSYMTGWGLPSSTIPDAGGVTACVKRVITPLPFATVAHEHDRYQVVVPIDW